MKEIKDKVVIITGAANGIGAGLAKAFVNEGAKHVIILDLDSKNGQELQNELNAKHGDKKAVFIKCDMLTDFERTFEKVKEEYGYIDVLVNNAGIMNDHKNVYRKQVALNVDALIIASMLAYEAMRKDRGGRGGTIVNTASVVALMNTPLLPIYSATKSAVLQLSLCLGAEPHYSRSGVRFITVCYSLTRTALAVNYAGIDDETTQGITDLFSQIEPQSPDSAVKGVIEAFKRGESASTWLMNQDQPAKDITPQVKQAYGILESTLQS